MIILYLRTENVRCVYNTRPFVYFYFTQIIITKPKTIKPSKFARIHLYVIMIIKAKSVRINNWSTHADELAQYTCTKTAATAETTTTTTTTNTTTDSHPKFKNFQQHPFCLDFLSRVLRDFQTRKNKSEKEKKTLIMCTAPHTHILWMLMCIICKTETQQDYV